MFLFVETRETFVPACVPAERGTVVSDGDWWGQVTKSGIASREKSSFACAFYMMLFLPFGVSFQVSSRPAAAVHNQVKFVRGIGRPILRPCWDFYSSVNGLSNGPGTPASHPSVVNRWRLYVIQPDSVAHTQRDLTR